MQGSARENSICGSLTVDLTGTQTKPIQQAYLQETLFLTLLIFTQEVHSALEPWPYILREPGLRLLNSS